MKLPSKILLGFSPILACLLIGCASHRAADDADLTNLIIQEVREETIIKIQEKEPLVAADIIELIQKQIETDSIARILQSRGGTYLWTEAELKQFRAAGADEALISVLASIPRSAEKPNATAFDKTGYKAFQNPPIDSMGRQ